MRCNVHGKASLGSCQWCGKSLCRYCEFKRDGRKLYCKECGAQLSTIRRVKLPETSVRQPSAIKDTKKDEKDIPPKIIPYYD